MRLFHFLAISFLAFFSCTSKQDRNTSTNNDKPSLVGKWHRFSVENGYTEFDIDSQNVVFYNQKVGRFELPYKIENDSLKYLNSRYAAKITFYGDSVFLQGNDNTTATLYRFKDVEAPFKAIPLEKDSASFASYIAGFDKRLISEFEKAGIQISGPVGEAPADTTYQQLLKQKNNQ